MDKDLIIQLQQEQLRVQARLIAEQNTMIKLLESRIVLLENNQKKDSSNSSKPPSSDIGKVQRTKSLRMQSGKKPGGQHGHPGHTLSFSSTPDQIIVHGAKQCDCCGKNLIGTPVLNYERRQVFDIPAIEMLVTEHKSEVKSCPRCHTISRGAFPATISQPVQYGPNVQQLAVYFTQYQLLPYQRTSQIFKDLFGHALSSSFLVVNNHRCANNLQPFIEDLKAKLLKEPVLHADETGFYFEGQRNWLHAISTDDHSYYAVHSKRGTEAMNDINILPGYKGVLVHDFWKSYHDFDCSHGLCNVHHLRDLTFCHEVENSRWAAKAKQLLLDVHAKVQMAKDAGASALSKGQWQYWSKKYDDLVNEGVRLHPVAEKQKGKRGIAKKTKTQNMIERFGGYKEQILAFVTNFLVPFSNNKAEQAIRMMKVKQKISGCFRSQQGAQDFAYIRSYIATMKKQGISIIEALGHAINGSPFYSSA
jgi:transposase